MSTLATILKTGSRGDEVVELQNALNAKSVPSPKLTPDGKFGGLTYQAVLKFQAKNWLVEDGQVGPCTWNCLMETETYTPILHKLQFTPQPDSHTCWAASTAMINSSTVPTVKAKTPSDLLNDQGELLNNSETRDPNTVASRYAQIHGLTVLAPMSWMPVGLKNMLKNSPLMFDMLWDTHGYTTANPVAPGEYIGSSGHIVVVVGIRGDDDQSGFGTTLRVFDPWPPRRGRIYSVGYMKWMQEVPTRTYHIYHR